MREQIKSVKSYEWKLLDSKSMLQLICLKFLILYNGISRIVVILCKIHKVIVINILFPQHRLTIIDKHSDRTGIVKLIEHYLESLP